MVNDSNNTYIHSEGILGLVVSLGGGQLIVLSICLDLCLRGCKSLENLKMVKRMKNM